MPPPRSLSMLPLSTLRVLSMTTVLGRPAALYRCRRR
jgi:hypothetical protein